MQKQSRIVLVAWAVAVAMQVWCQPVLIGQEKNRYPRSNYERYVEGLVKTYDRNRDGKLDSAEMKEIRLEVPLQVDLDNDGKFSRRELVAWLTRSRSDTSDTQDESASRAEALPDEVSVPKTVPESLPNRNRQPVTQQFILLDHRSAAEIAEVIRSVYEAYGHLGQLGITVDRGSNQIIVVGGEQTIRLVNDLASKLDVPARPTRNNPAGNQDRRRQTRAQAALGGLSGQMLGSAIGSSGRATRKPNTPAKQIRLGMTLLRLPPATDSGQASALIDEFEGMTIDESSAGTAELIRQHDLQVVDRVEFEMPDGKVTTLENSSTESVPVASNGKAYQYQSYNVGMQLEVSSNVKDDGVHLDLKLTRSLIDRGRSEKADDERIQAPAILKFLMDTGVLVKNDRFTAISVSSSGCDWLLLVSARIE